MNNDYANKETEKKLKALEKALEKTYAKASDEVAEKLNTHLSKFATKDKIKRKQLANEEITESEYQYWRTGQVMMGKRWAKMRDTLAKDLMNVDKIAMSMVNDHRPDVYALNHNYATYEAEKGALVDTSYTLYDKHTVERLMRDNPQLLPPLEVDEPADLRWLKSQIDSTMMSDLLDTKKILWDDKDINDQLTQSILQGQSIPETARKLRDYSKSKYPMNSIQDDVAKVLSTRLMHSAIRNARTMTTGAQNAGRTDAYKRAVDMGVMMKQVWMAAIDGRTRHSHRILDGEEREVGKAFSNGLMFPADPDGRPEEIYNCRCTLVAKVKGMDWDASDMTERNNKLNGMSYEEWKEEHGASKRYNESVKKYQERTKN